MSKTLNQQLTVMLVVLHVLTIPAKVSLSSVNEKLLQSIKDYMDPTEKPCEYFYGYACGNWATHHDTERYVEATGLIDHKINKKLVNLFESYESETEFEEAEAEVYGKVKTYYKSCKREKKRSLHKYLQIVRPAKHLNWPIVEQLRNHNSTWSGQDFDWLLTLAKLRRYGLKSVMIEHLVLQKMENSTQYVIDLDKPTTASSEIPESTAAIAVFLMQLGLAKKQAILLAKQIHSFEQQLQKLVEIEYEYGMLEVTIQSLENELENMPWRRYIAIILEYDVDDDYALQIRNWNYFVALHELTAKTDAELICNYIMYKFLSYLTSDGTSSFDKIDCMVDVRSKMDLALNFIYKTRFYKSKAKEYNAEVAKIFSTLKTEFQSKLKSNYLGLNETHTKHLQKKLQELRLNMGNMPANVNYKFVADYYNKANLRLRNYYRNHLELLKLRFLKNHAQLTSPTPTAEHYFYIADSNTARSSTPFYLMRKNVVVVPYGFLQPPMFHINMHDIFKYSVFGFLLAHEIVHAFDATGVAYDFHGNTQDVGLEISEQKNFTDALNCLERDETQSLDERIADIVGVRIAFDALFGTLEPTQPNFTLIPKKRLFFLNLAQFFCGSLTAAFMEHDSDNVRLQETLLNFEPFAKEFNCDLGDVMHPAEKCRVW